MSTLQAALDVDTRQLLLDFGFDELEFEQLRRRLIEGHAEADDNRVRGRLHPPQAEDIMQLAAIGSREHAQLTAAGRAALVRGEACVLVLAGGMATRFGGVVKAGVEVLPGATFLDLKLRQVARCAQELGVRIQVLLMTSFATDREVQRLIAGHPHAALDIDTFPQLISLRLRPSGELFRDADGRASPYAPGHGDLVFALKRAGWLQRLRARGVRYLFLSNVDNVAATLDPAVLGAHVLGTHTMTFEVAAMQAGDKGGVPARLDGRLQVIEALRYPVGFVESSIPWFSINNLTFTLAALEPAFALDWFRVDKRVGDEPAVQFERLANQLTAFLPARALAVERDGPEGRFLPVKDRAELAQRLPAIRSLLARSVR